MLGSLINAAEIWSAMAFVATVFESLVISNGVNPEPVVSEVRIEFALVVAGCEAELNSVIAKNDVRSVFFMFPSCVKLEIILFSDKIELAFISPVESNDTESLLPIDVVEAESIVIVLDEGVGFEPSTLGNGAELASSSSDDDDTESLVLIDVVEAESIAIVFDEVAELVSLVLPDIFELRSLIVILEIDSSVVCEAAEYVWLVLIPETGIKLESVATGEDFELKLLVLEYGSNPESCWLIENFVVGFSTLEESVGLESSALDDDVGVT